MPTLELRPMTPAWHLPTIGGYEEPAQWERVGGILVSRYDTPEQLFLAVACVLDDAALRRLLVERQRQATERKRAERLRGESLRLRGF